MNTKLTLTVQKDVIEKAKGFAKAKGRSLSDIVENYLKAITSDDDKVEPLNTPITDSLRGSFEVPKDFNYKKTLVEELEKKHLKS